RNRLPAAMSITISLEIDPRLAGYNLEDMQRPTQTFHRVIFFPMSSELTMSVRPLVPSYVEPRSEEAGGGDLTGGGGGEGGTNGGNAGEGGNAPPPGSGNNGGGNKGGGGTKPPPGEGPGPGENPGFPNPDPNKDPPPPGGGTDLQDLLNLLGGGGHK
ncbi:MAG: hypothetical protein ABIK28_15230, partial [Planctomycetota bacterium]